MSYHPEPIDTSRITLPDEIVDLTEQLAKNAHDVYARQRMADGWRYGPKRNDDARENPTLIPYEDLPESEKEYDRKTAVGTLKAIVALGYRVVKA
jgi:hypothetical protein